MYLMKEHNTGFPCPKNQFAEYIAFGIWEEKSFVRVQYLLTFSDKLSEHIEAKHTLVIQRGFIRQTILEILKNYTPKDSFDICLASSITTLLHLEDLYDMLHDIGAKLSFAVTAETIDNYSDVFGLIYPMRDYTK
jgi:hypothetical protein